MEGMTPRATGEMLAQARLRVQSDGPKKLTEQSPSNVVRNLSLECCSKSTRDDLAKGNEECIGTNASSSYGSWSQLSNVKGANHSSSANTHTENDAANDHLGDGVRGCDDDSSNCEAFNN